MYYKRCCSVYDVYNLLSKDNPCYVERKLRRVDNANGRFVNRESLAVQEGQNKSERREPPAVQDNEDRQGRIQTFSKGQAFRPTKSDPNYNPDIIHMARISNPAYNPFIHASVQAQRRVIVNVKSTNPSDPNRDQRDAAEKAER